VLSGFEIASFWEPSEYAKREYVDDPITDMLVREVERSLGANYAVRRPRSDFRAFRRSPTPVGPVTAHLHARPGLRTMLRFTASLRSEPRSPTRCAVKWATRSGRQNGGTQR
jgi:hypothetical protein